MAMSPTFTCHIPSSCAIGWKVLSNVLFFVATLSLQPVGAAVTMIDLAQRVKLDDRQVSAELSAADVILIGEHHDDPAHHRVQAVLLDTLLKAERKPVVLFEMLTERQEARYTRYRQNVGIGATQSGAQELEGILEWSVRGWPILPAYLPLFALAEEHSLEVGHAELPTELVRNITRYGVVAIPKSLRERLFNPLNAEDFTALVDRLAQVVSKAHGVPPSDPRIGGLIAAQLAKDAYMALRVSALSGPVVLIAGADHVRTDIGVPLHLVKRGFKGKVLSINMVNDASDGEGADENSLARNVIKPSFDWVWVDDSLEGKK